VGNLPACGRRRHATAGCLVQLPCNHDDNDLRESWRPWDRGAHSILGITLTGKSTVPGTFSIPDLPHWGAAVPGIVKLHLASVLLLQMPWAPRSQESRRSQERSQSQGWSRSQSYRTGAPRSQRYGLRRNGHRRGGFQTRLHTGCLGIVMPYSPENTAASYLLTSDLEFSRWVRFSEIRR